MDLIQVSAADCAALNIRDGAAEYHFESLIRLLGWLDTEKYDFVAPTPATHQRVVARPDRQIGRTVADLLGWSLPCPAETLPPELIVLLDEAGVLERCGEDMLRARVRVSRVLGNLFVHSAYPTVAQDAVFLGPDSHRFGDFILRNLGELPRPTRVLDYGAGAGVGGVTATAALGNAMLTLADINTKALLLADINASFAGVVHATVKASSPQEVEGSFDLIVMHPPFMMDSEGRAYRDGGDLYGGKLSLDWALAALDKLAPGGRLIMHTGVSIVNGRDVFLDALRALMPAVGYEYDYRLLDPDIFGDELDQEPYAGVDRIAAIGLCVTRTSLPVDCHG